ncbi:hypothetical protein GCM10010319_12920 [Streptomyces blastmyceticus]|uniref:Uncharacterized protein n=1 Tax=Streptomyces blastmyceticus TaxID=68180 RepID=A0ABN0WI39_9ACTN
MVRARSLPPRRISGTDCVEPGTEFGAPVDEVAPEEAPEGVAPDEVARKGRVRAAAQVTVEETRIPRMTEILDICR